LLQAFHVVDCADPTGLALPSAPKHRNPDFPQRGDATMTERRPIFSTTGDYIGYTEGDAAFDLFDRQCCIYNAETGTLAIPIPESLLAMYRQFRCAVADCGRAIWATL
jgi:hypothetical protein